MAADAMRRATGLRHDALQVRIMCDYACIAIISLLPGLSAPPFAPSVADINL